MNGIVGNMNGKYYRENEWWVSPYNFVPEVRSTFQLPARVSIHDATLRDGEQTPGVVFSIADKVAIAEKLAEIGVDRIEAGMPAVSEQDFQAIKEISKLGLKSKIYTFARAMNADIDKALECGCQGVIIEIPIGYPKLKYQFKWTWEDVLRKSIGVVNYAKSRGMHVVYFPYDTTRAREEDLTNLLTRLMQEAPPDSVGVVDTMGCILPEAMKYMVRLVKSLTNLPVEVHTHNDFGMAVATELAGVEAGAEVVHSCANGLGERTGNAALEELIVALHVLYGYETHYDLAKLPELGELVSRISQFDIALNKPILGDRNFTRESGHRRRSGGEGAAGDVRHASGINRTAWRSGAGKEERQSVHHLQPRADGHHRRRRRGGFRDAQARERQRHRKARLAHPGRVQGNRRRRTRCQALSGRSL